MDILSRTLVRAAFSLTAPLGAAALAACSLGLDRSLMTATDAGAPASAVVPRAGEDDGDEPESLVDAGTAPTSAPVLLGLTPVSALVGASDLQLTATGAGFAPGSTIVFAGSALASTLGGSGTLTAVLPAPLITRAGSFDVTVSSAAAGGGTSRALAFIVANPGGVSITSVTPSRVDLEAEGVELALTGSGFVSGSVVSLNGTALRTTFVSAETLTASVPRSALTTAGSYPVTVTNPSPGGGMSVPATLNVENPPAVITSVSPNAIEVRSGNTEIVVAGSAFRPGATVTFNGRPLATRLASSTELRATVPSSMLGYTGRHDISAFNVAPGGGGSGVAALEVFVRNLVLNPSFEQGGTSWDAWWDAPFSQNANVFENQPGRTGARRLLVRSPASQYTFQVLKNLPDASYALSGWFQSSGGHEALNLSVKNCGGARNEMALPRTPISAWTQFTLSGISVVGGQCEIAVWYEAWNPSSWLLVDDVAFVKM